MRLVASLIAILAAVALPSAATARAVPCSGRPWVQRNEDPGIQALHAANLPARSFRGTRCYIAREIASRIQYYWNHSPSSGRAGLPSRISIDPDGQTWRVDYQNLQPQYTFAESSRIRATAHHHHELVTMILIWT